MNKYFIKKTVIAKNIKDAIKKEKTAEISEVYQDYQYQHKVNNPIGFKKR